MPRDPGNWLKANAGGFDYLSREEKRVIGDFLFLWSLFESQIHNFNAGMPRILSTIDQWAEEGLLENERTRDCWSYFLDRLREDDDFTYHLDGLKIQRAQDREFLEDALTNGRDVSDHDMHKSLSIIVYRIRNNLMHGEKWAYGLGGQRDNFRYSNEMLMVWMEIHKTKEV